MSTPYGLVIELSRNEKLQKYGIILSQHTNYFTNDWSTKILTCLLLPCLFLFALRFLNRCKPRTTFYLLWAAHLDWNFMEVDCMLTELAVNSGCRMAWFNAIRNYLADETYYLSRLFLRTGCLFTWSAHFKIICSLFSPFCMFQNAIFHKVNARVLRF